MKLQKTYNKLILESGDGDVYENAIKLLWSGDKDNIDIVFSSFDWMDMNKLDRYIQKSFNFLIYAQGGGYGIKNKIPIDREFFEWIGTTDELYLSQSWEKIIPKNIANFKNLTFLEATKCELTYIDDALYSLTGLVVLNLDNNKLTEIGENVSKLEKLEILALAGNNLTELPIQSIQKLDLLDTLDVSENYLNYDSEYLKQTFEWVNHLYISKQKTHEDENY